MDGLEFRKRGREMVDYMVDYLENIDARRVTPNIEPGYLQVPRFFLTMISEHLSFEKWCYFSWINSTVCPLFILKY